MLLLSTMIQIILSQTEVKIKSVSYTDFSLSVSVFSFRNGTTSIVQPPFPHPTPHQTVNCECTRRSSKRPLETWKCIIVISEATSNSSASELLATRPRHFFFMMSMQLSYVKTNLSKLSDID